MSAGFQTRDIHVGTKQAWHNKTNVVTRIDRSNCGIVYAMEKRQLHILDSQGNPITKQEPIEDKKGNVVGYNTVPASDHFSIVSLDDQLPIGNPVKSGYQLISNEQMFDMVEESLKGTSHEIISVGSIGNREKVFCSVKLADNFIAGGRDTENVLNVLWGHGGVFGVVARSGMTVVVCANTFAMALGKKGKKMDLAVRHTGNSVLKIENMSKAIDSHYGVTAEFKRAMDEVAAMPLPSVEAKQAIAGFLVRNTEELEEVSTRTSNAIDRIHTLFSGGTGNKGKDRCDLFNAFTDYYSHESSGGEDRWKQFESSEFGAGNQFKTEAFGLVTGENVPKLGMWADVVKRGQKVLDLV